MSVIDGQA